MVFGEDVVLLRGHPRVKKKRTVMIPVYAGHIRGCEKKRDKRVSSGSPETEQMPFPYGGGQRYSTMKSLILAQDER